LSTAAVTTSSTSADMSADMDSSCARRRRAAAAEGGGAGRTRVGCGGGVQRRSTPRSTRRSCAARLT
jgi:hypothetical protein